MTTANFDPIVDANTTMIFFTANVHFEHDKMKQIETDSILDAKLQM